MKLVEKEARNRNKEKGIVFIPSSREQSDFACSVTETAAMGPHVHIAAPSLCGQ